jgi:hypothetical protein
VVAVFDHIIRALASVRQHKAHTGRNPRTGETLPATARAAPHFIKASRELLRRLNGAPTIAAAPRPTD